MAYQPDLMRNLEIQPLVIDLVSFDYDHEYDYDNELRGGPAHRWISPRRSRRARRKEFDQLSSQVIGCADLICSESRTGLLINFNVTKLKKSIKCFIL